MLASLSANWAGVYIALASLLGGVITWFVQQRRAARKKLVDATTKEAQAPANELAVATRAAEAVTGAAVQLLEPFQKRVTEQATQIGQLQEAITLSRTAEARCQDELAAVRFELHETKTKLREVTDHLGLEPPDGHPPKRRSSD
jgi:predicted  nucleic acid-binding Zn-ribbon protein